MIKVKVTEKYYLEDNFQAFETNCSDTLSMDASFQYLEQMTLLLFRQDVS